MSGATILETERLRLSMWTDGAVDELMVLHGDPEVARYLDVQGRVYDRPKAEQRLTEWQREYAEYGICKFRLSLKDDDAFVGRAGFSLHGRDGPEIGYALTRAQWGKGYASEAAAGLRDWLFRETDWEHFIGFADVRNTASCATLRRIGMVPTHVAETFGLTCQFHILEKPKP